MDIIQRSNSTLDIYKAKLEKWLENVPKWHDHFVWTPNHKAEWTIPIKPLKESKVALVSTAGIHLKSQKPFDVINDHGDWSYRYIPSSTGPGDIMISDLHYDHSEADLDINCIFPISHINSLKQEGIIGDVANDFFGFMGFIPDPEKLIKETAPQVASMLIEDEVDLVFLTPG